MKVGWCFGGVAVVVGHLSAVDLLIGWTIMAKIFFHTKVVSDSTCKASLNPVSLSFKQPISR